MASKQIHPAFVANPAHLIDLGRALVASGEGEKAIALVNQALAAAPDDPLVREAASEVLTHKVPRFHPAMLADAPRNDSYAEAIARALSGGESVLDVGTGSGLLAMMAARAGAARVVACEANTMLAATAREIAAANGFDAIRVLGKNSTDLTLEEVGGPVDVIVHEVFAHDVIAEGVLGAMADAVSRLARPGVKVIPARASVRVALAHFDPASAPTDRGAADQFDLGLFSRHMRTVVRLPVGSRHLELRSEPHDLVEFDFTDPSSLGEGRASLTAASTGGRVNGVVQWLSIWFDEGPHYENRPAPGASSHWKALFHPFEAAATEPGERFAIQGWHHGDILRIWAARAQKA